MGHSNIPSSEAIRRKEKVNIKKNTDTDINPKELNKQHSPIEKKLQTKFNKNIRIISIFLMFLAVLIFLSLISYTPKDEANTEVSLNELLSIFKGNIELKEKAAQTINWLGIFGAIVSNFLYNSTIGYSVLFFPVFLSIWSWNLFKRLSISAKLIKHTIGFSILAITISGFIATLSLIPWFFELSKEYYGAIGLFLAMAISSMIGVVGSFLLFTLFLCLVIVYLIKLFNYNYYLKLKEYVKNLIYNFFEYFKRKPKEKKQTNVNMEKEIPSVVPLQAKKTTNTSTQENPAWIIQKNIEFTERRDSLNKFRNDNKIVENQNVIDSRIQTAKEPLEQKSKTPEIIIKRNPHLPVIEKIIIEDKPNEEKEEIIQTNDLKNDDINKYQNEIESMEAEEKLEQQEGVLDNESDENTDSEVSQIILSHSKPLTLTIEQKPVAEYQGEEYQLSSPLSTAILDEEINYLSPHLGLLGNFDDETFIDEEELKQNAQILQDKLETFKIVIENLAVTPGPVVTQYEFVPAAGIKISRIENLSDDIAMALKAKGIRIIAPIPGKGTVGIEIPNKKPSMVSFSSLAKSNKFLNTNLNLPMALGKTISGDVFCTDLTKMPHLLIAGATGAGKSVGINTIIASLLYKMHPRYLKFVIVDPKKVELKQYAQLENHFLAVSPDIDNSIISDPQEAVIVLKAVCAEMDLRYDILSKVGQRNIFEYNAKVREGKFKDDKEILHKEMPYIVVVIDELADLMLTASKEVEGPIIRLAQLARAVGIHCIVATQRPSVDVITGIIKANFPARISYLVASKIDSRTILDVSGAEQLLGMGDMLFLAGGSPKPIRIQNAFISTDEVEEICAFIGNQKGYSQPYKLPSLVEKNTASAGISQEDRDPLFEEAAKLIIQQQQASVSLVQRRLKVGYARAGRIIDELEDAGVIGPFDGSKARAVYMESESELEAVLW